jgi:hypothetical protein
MVDANPHTEVSVRKCKGKYDYLGKDIITLVARLWLLEHVCPEKAKRPQVSLFVLVLIPVADHRWAVRVKSDTNGPYNILLGHANCAGVYVNDAGVGLPKRNQVKCNVRLVESPDGDDDDMSSSTFVTYQAVAPIEAGEVLWGYYGPEYWRDGLRDDGDDSAREEEPEEEEEDSPEEEEEASKQKKSKKQGQRGGRCVGACSCTQDQAEEETGHPN